LWMEAGRRSTDDFSRRFDKTQDRLLTRAARKPDGLLDS
jgi:hypothetical protein